MSVHNFPEHVQDILKKCREQGAQVKTGFVTCTVDTPEPDLQAALMLAGFHQCGRQLYEWNPLLPWYTRRIP